MWELDHKEGWVLKNWYFWIVMLEKTLETPLESKEIKPVNSEGNQPWIFTGRTDAEAESPILWPPDTELAHWKRPWCWERLRAGGEGGNRRWDGWMASLTQWTWVWTNSGRWWRTRKPGVLQSVGLQRVGHSLVAKKTPPQQMDRPAWNNQQSKTKQNIRRDVLFRLWTSGNKYEDPREMRVRHGAQSAQPVVLREFSGCGTQRGSPGGSLSQGNEAKPRAVKAAAGRSTWKQKATKREDPEG